jgi:hypothetical protein
MTLADMHHLSSDMQSAPALGIQLDILRSMARTIGSRNEPKRCQRCERLSSLRRTPCPLCARKLCADCCRAGVGGRKFTAPKSWWAICAECYDGPQWLEGAIWGAGVTAWGGPWVLLPKRLELDGREIWHVTTDVTIGRVNADYYIAWNGPDDIDVETRKFSACRMMWDANIQPLLERFPRLETLHTDQELGAKRYASGHVPIEFTRETLDEK